VFWRLESYAMPFFYHQVCFAMFVGLGKEQTCRNV